jgi:cysteine desulfurase
MKLPIYMDYHATTPVDPRVIERMTPYFTDVFGNASSRSHSFGWKAAEAIAEARKHVATIIGARAEEIYFTSGATESDNLAIKGVATRLADRGRHVITTRIEHKAILDSCSWLEEHGFEITYLLVNGEGFIDPTELERAITPQTILVSIMMANNEIGSVQPMEEIGRITRAKGVLLHTDAAQGVGKIPVDVERMNIDLLSLTAHKMYGPKGIGVLYIRGEEPLSLIAPAMVGGGQENKVRSGTLNVPGIVGLGETCRICLENLELEVRQLAVLRDRLKDGIISQLDSVQVNGPEKNRLSHNLSVSFAGLDAETFMMSLSDIAVSTGSACASGSMNASHVLESIGISEEYAPCTIRFGLGRFNTVEEVDYVIGRVVETVQGIREISTDTTATSNAGSK